MNLKKIKTLQLAFFCLMQITFAIGVSQTKVEHPKKENLNLYDEISKMDSLFFSAYNNTEIEKYQSFISDDIEFFHDKNGFINAKQRIVNNLKDIAKTEKNSSYSIKRELIKNTLEVHDISGYGALETGQHQFIEVRNGKKLITKAKFMHLWKKQDGNWIITKAFSYDHQPVKEKVNPDKNAISLTIKQMDAYLGDYQFAPEFILTIVREGQKLYGMAQGDKIEIKPYELHKFLIMRDNSKLEFIPDENNNMIGIEMQTKKGVMKAKKINTK